MESIMSYTVGGFTESQILIAFPKESTSFGYEKMENVLLANVTENQSLITATHVTIHRH